MTGMVTLISEEFAQLEMNNDRCIDGENRENNNNRSGLCAIIR